MEQQPDWLEKPSAKPAAPALRREAPWRTPGTRKPAAAPAKPEPKPRARRTHSVLEAHVLPLVFLAVLVLVIGGYLAGWHLG